MKYKSGRLGKHRPLDKPEVGSGAYEDDCRFLWLHSICGTMTFKKLKSGSISPVRRFENFYPMVIE
jgi:hypothetical protein